MDVTADLKMFKQMTNNHTMIMGRKTFESLPGVLPNRKHSELPESHRVKRWLVSETKRILA